MARNIAYYRRLRQFGSVLFAVLMIGLISFMGVRFYEASKASPAGRLYISSAQVNVSPGTAVSFTVREDSGTAAVDAVRFALNYDPADLRFVGLVEGGVFGDSTLTDMIQPGSIRMQRSTAAAVTGDQPVVTLNFKVVGAAGETKVGLDVSGSALMSEEGNVLSGAENYQLNIAESTAKDAVFSMVPATGTLARGTSLSVAVRLNNPTQHVFSAQPVVMYSAKQLQFTGASNSMLFPSDVRTTASAGNLDIIRGVAVGNPGFIGDDSVVTLNFKVISTTGSIDLNFSDTSGVFDANGRNILSHASEGAHFTVAAQTNLPPAQLPPSPVATASESTAKAVVGNNIEIVPQSGGVAAVKGKTTEVRGVVMFASAAMVRTTSVKAQDELAKVEYYLDGTRVSTKTNEPFTYTFDTNQLENGNHRILIKNYYQSGRTDTISDTLNVSNPVTLSYVMAHYGREVTASFFGLIVLIFVIWRYVLPRFGHHGAALAGFTGDVDRRILHAPSREYTAPGPAVVKPIGSNNQGILTPEQTAAPLKTPSIVKEDNSSETKPPRRKPADDFSSPDRRI